MNCKTYKWKTGRTEDFVAEHGVETHRTAVHDEVSGALLYVFKKRRIAAGVNGLYMWLNHIPPREFR